MVIRKSSSSQVEWLITELCSDSATAREAAAARLAVIGSRAVDRLARVVRDKQVQPSARILAIGALETIGDARGIDAVLPLVDAEDAELARAAIRAAGSFLLGARDVAIVDRLAAVAMNGHRPVDVRSSAIRALGGLDFATLKPLIDALGADPDPVISALAAVRSVDDRRAAASPPTRERALERVAGGVLPDDPALLRHAIALSGGGLALPVLQRLVERVRDREKDEPAGRRLEWTAVRAAAHVALAGRGCRLALYDLRETLEAASEALPVEFVTALTTLGDLSCLEPIAAAYSRIGDAWWRQHLAEAFGAIVVRERATRRHAVARRIAKRWPQAFDELWRGPASSRITRSGH